MFKVNTDGTGFVTLYSFTGGSDGARPYAGLILSGNTLYGTASNRGNSYDEGTVFAVNTDGTGFTTLHSFIHDGARTYAGLIISGNTLYGTTISASIYGDGGSVFAVNTDGSDFTTLYNFTPNPNEPGEFFTNSDGGYPSGLILSGNTLYGTAALGGSSGSGTLFAVNTNGTGFTTLYNFTAYASSSPYTNSDGAGPRARLILSGNTLYGTAAGGGSSGNGTMFAVNTDGTGFTTLHTFTATAVPPYNGGTNSDGANPDSGLILSGNTLYGTASRGGSSGSGTVFALSLSPSAPIITTLPASSITTSSARLNAALNANGSGLTAYFEYGTTTNYGNTTLSFGSITNSRDISFTVSGLATNTTYHYRVIANGTNIIRGNDVTFTTLPTSITGQAWVSGTDGLGLRLRASPSISASVLLIMPEGSVVTLLGETQNADGYLWRRVRFGTQEGWAAAQFLVLTPSSPPGAPTTLRQLRSDGVTAIPSGGSINTASVVLSAVASGTSVQQFKIQFEVRPSGATFSAATHESALVRGGTEAKVTVSGLSNQGYHWRARIVDGNGQPGSWVQFGSGGADFAINAPKLASALFRCSPSLVFTGDTIQFTADAAGTSGLTFQWDFDGQTATGSTVNRSFSQTGNVNVRLTVTDSQGNSSEHTEIIPVVSKQLADRINQLVQRTSTSLDEVLAKAEECAEAADYFQRGVSSAESRILLSAAFDAIGLGMSAVDFKKLLKISLNDAAVDTVSEVTQNLTLWGTESLLESHFTQRRSYSEIFLPNLTAYITQKKADLEQLHQQALTASASLTPQQAEQLARNLQARSLGNIAVAGNYGNKAHLAVTYADLKSFDENSGTFVWSERVFDLSVGLGLVASGGSVHGLAAVMLTVSSSAGLGTLDKLKILSAQSTDAQMLSLSVDLLAQGTFASKEMYENTKLGLEAVRDAQVPFTPAGQMAVEHVAKGKLEVFGFSPRWFTTEAYARITVNNTSTASAEYQVEAVYPYSFTTTQLLPVHAPFGIGERRYDINVLSLSAPFVLSPGQERTLTIDYLTGESGRIPKGLLTYTLTAKTADGRYRMDSKSGQFGTTFIDENGNVVEHSQGVLLETSPLNSSLLQFSGSSICTLNIQVKNPLEYPLPVNLQQDISPALSVIDAGGGVFNNNQLTWELDMLPEESRFVQVTLQLSTPLGLQPLPDTTLSAYDAPNASWLQFSATPSLIKTTESPAPILQAMSSTMNGFGIASQTFVPGVYGVEATKDFSVWETVMTYTNSQGSISNIQDSAATTNAVRFYRAIRLP